jgi:spermidine/putrescine transport system ATP-binding protein
MTQHPIAAFQGVSKLFGEIVAADSIDLTIRRGEFLSFLGPSGCGKTTALRMLAGFEFPTTGNVLLDGARVNDVPAHRRAVNMVFQHYALFPHLTVARNISYGLRQRRPRLPAAEISAKVERMLETVQLPGFANRRIWEMSGGQQQRVALARALINEPKLLLLDEPMAALDRKLRREMQIELQTLQRQLGITFVLVTHDQEEALSMSDRTCIMHAGRIVQVGSPRELYDRPVSRYVADFVGKSNFFDGRLRPDGNGTGCVETAAGLKLFGRCEGELAQGSTVSLSLRPEQISLSRGETAPASRDICLPVAIRNRIFLGEHTEYLVHHRALGEFLVLVPRQSEAVEGSFETGQEAWARWTPGAALILRNDQSLPHPTGD